jgi:hypothetical protein
VAPQNSCLGVSRMMSGRDDDDDDDDDLSDQVRSVVKTARATPAFRHINVFGVHDAQVTS